MRPRPLATWIAMVLASCATPLTQGMPTGSPNHPTQWEDLPDELVGTVMQYMDGATAHNLYQSNQRHHELGRDHFERKFTTNVQQQWNRLSSQWYRAADLLITPSPGPSSAEQFRWIIQEKGAPFWTDVQLSRLAVKCGRVGWQEGLQILLATGRVSSEAQYLATHLEASDFAQAEQGNDLTDILRRPRPIPKPAIRSSLFLDARHPETEATMLKVSAAHGHEDRVDMLVEEGAQVNLRSRQGVSALQFAVLSGNAKSVQKLVDAGADLNAQSDDGATALILAARGHPELARLLIQAGADLNVQDVHGFTALMVAAWDNHVEIVRSLLEAGADPTVKDHFGWPVLFSAAQKMHAEVVRMLVEAGGDVHGADGMTALSGAVSLGDLGAAEVLVEAGVNVNQRNLDGNTPLSQAVQERDAVMAQFLVNSGADVNVRGLNGGSLLQLAQYMGDQEVLRVLHQAGAR